MIHFLRCAIFLALVALVAGAAESAPKQETAAVGPESAPPKRPELKVITGPAKVPIGKVAELNLPASYRFVPPESLDKFFEITHNLRSGHELGVVVAPSGWMLLFTFDDTGYVKDDEKNNLDADKIYQALVSSEENTNQERKRRGWDEMKKQGWAKPPYYDDKSHHLKWAFRLASSRDQYKEIWVNENIRLLGRTGVMNLTLASDLNRFSVDDAEAEQLLANFDYVAGQRYAEYRSGDKVAKYGLAALVIGGAGAVALKTGLLAKLWKPIIVALAALGSAISRFWKKLIGKEPTDDRR